MEDITNMEEVNLELPDHKKQLEKAKKLLSKVETKFKPYYKKELNKIKNIMGDDFNETLWIESTQIPMPDDKRLVMITIVNRVLDAVADLSTSRFDVRDSLEKYYIIKYKKNPKLGNTLFLNHYHSIHKPYDKIKNQCFNLIEKLN